MDRFRTELAWLIVGVIVCSVGCGKTESTATRTWQASDHAQAPEHLVDPNRVPAQDFSNAEAREKSVATMLFQTHCVQCHGGDGKGVGPMLSAGVDFTSDAWQKSRTDEAIVAVISNGRPPMPAFADKLNEAQMRSMVAFIRSFGAEPEASPEPKP
ncbi:MAG: cytochrome c [Polyangiales bacterium]